MNFLQHNIKEMLGLGFFIKDKNIVNILEIIKELKSILKCEHKCDSISLSSLKNDKLKDLDKIIEEQKIIERCFLYLTQSVDIRLIEFILKNLKLTYKHNISSKTLNVNLYENDTFYQYTYKYDKLMIKYWNIMIILLDIIIFLYYIKKQSREPENVQLDQYRVMKKKIIKQYFYFYYHKQNTEYYLKLLSFYFLLNNNKFTKIIWTKPIKEYKKNEWENELILTQRGIGYRNPYFLTKEQHEQLLLDEKYGLRLIDFKKKIVLSNWLSPTFNNVLELIDDTRYSKKRLKTSFKIIQHMNFNLLDNRFLYWINHYQKDYWEWWGKYYNVTIQDKKQLDTLDGLLEHLKSIFVQQFDTKAKELKETIDITKPISLKQMIIERKNYKNYYYLCERFDKYNETNTGCVKIKGNKSEQWTTKLMLMNKKKFLNVDVSKFFIDKKNLSPSDISDMNFVKNVLHKFNLKFQNYYLSHFYETLHSYFVIDFLDENQFKSMITYMLELYLDFYIDRNKSIKFGLNNLAAYLISSKRQICKNVSTLFTLNKYLIRLQQDYEPDSIEYVDTYIQNVFLELKDVAYTRPFVLYESDIIKIEGTKIVGETLDVIKKNDILQKMNTFFSKYLPKFITNTLGLVGVLIDPLKGIIKFFTTTVQEILTDMNQILMKQAIDEYIKDFLQKNNMKRILTDFNPKYCLKNLKLQNIRKQYYQVHNNALKNKSDTKNYLINQINFEINKIINSFSIESIVLLLNKKIIKLSNIPIDKISNNDLKYLKKEYFDKNKINMPTQLYEKIKPDIEGFETVEFFPFQETM